MALTLVMKGTLMISLIVVIWEEILSIVDKYHAEYEDELIHSCHIKNQKQFDVLMGMKSYLMQIPLLLIDFRIGHYKYNQFLVLLNKELDK
jgi:hypothetical protein